MAYNVSRPLELECRVQDRAAQAVSGDVEEPPKPTKQLPSRHSDVTKDAPTPLILSPVPYLIISPFLPHLLTSLDMYSPRALLAILAAFALLALLAPLAARPRPPPEPVEPSEDVRITVGPEATLIVRQKLGEVPFL